MWPDRVSNPGPLALESDALPTALLGPADFGAQVNTVTQVSTRTFFLHLRSRSSFDL